MAFTHDQPRGKRHTAYAYEPSTTDYVTTNFVSTYSESETRDNGYKSETKSEGSIKSFDELGKIFRGYSRISSGSEPDGDKTNDSYTFKGQIGLTTASTKLRRESPYGVRQTTTKYTANYQSSKSVMGAFENAGSSGSAYYNGSDGASKANSFKRTGNSVGTSSTNRFGSQISDSRKGTSQYGQSNYNTFTRDKTGEGETGTEQTTSSTTYGDTDTYEPDPGTSDSPIRVYRFQTSLGESTGEVVTRSITTTDSDLTYTRIDPDNILLTITDTVTYKAHSFGDTYNFTQTLQTYESEYLPITGYFGTTYNLSSAYGGAVFITGGQTLSNGVVTNADTTTSFSSFKSQPTNFNEETKELYKGIDGDLATTVTARDYTDVTTLAGFTSTDTVFTTTTEFEGGTYDFGDIVDDTVVKFTTSEQERFYQDTITLSDAALFTTTDRIYEGYTSVQFSGYASVTSNVEKSYLGSDGFMTTEFFSTVYSDTTYSKLVGHGRQTPVTPGHAAGATSRYVQPVSPISSRTGVGRVWYPIIRLITVDKGKQGGIQNEYKNEISDAVRSYRPISIADQKATTGTYTSPAANGNITANSADSNHYTFSGGLPLGLNISLNRYLSYLPNGDFGDIYSSKNSSGYLFSLEGDESLIHFSSTGKYSTSKNNSRTTQTFSTILRGKAEVQLGAQYNAGEKTQANMVVMGNNSIVGGQNFTDEDGTILDFNGRHPPLSYYIFGRNNSSYVSQGSTAIGTYNTYNTMTVVKNSVLFFKMSSFVTCDSSARATILR